MSKFRKNLYKIYTIFENLIAPKLIYSQEIFEGILRNNVQQKDVWLDLGCGHHLLSPWKLKQEIELIKIPQTIIGLDYDLLSLQKHKTIKDKVRGDISRLPFKDQSFNLITSNMVFEHLEDPEAQLKEIYRILKPGGKLIFHTPNAKGYPTLMARITPEKITSKILYILQGRIEEDIFPTYFKINTLNDIVSVAGKVGYHVDKIKMLASNAQFAMILPLAVIELIWIRISLLTKYKELRTSIVVILTKNFDNL